jgi:hypothetical protein
MYKGEKEGEDLILNVERLNTKTVFISHILTLKNGREKQN